MTTLQELYSKGRSLLQGSVAAPLVEAKVLLLKAVEVGEVDWLADPRRRASRAEEHRYGRLIERRLSGVPLAYITGRKEFWSLSLRVARDVLIPRPETELVVERALAAAKGSAPVIIDIGTGCGNIALALAKELPRARLYATDVSARALRVAEANARDHRVANVLFLRGSLFNALRGQGLAEQCDIIVSNPPYVSASEWEALPGEVRNYEPRRGLVGGKTGLEFIGRLVKGAPEFLKRGGNLVFEVGAGQAEKAIALLEEKPMVRCYRDAQSFNDLRGIKRIIQARL